MKIFNNSRSSAVFGAALVFCAFALGHAETHGPRVALGISGFNHKATVDKAIAGTDLMEAASIAYVVRVPINDIVSFLPEVQFSYATPLGEEQSDFRIDVPLMFRFFVWRDLFLQAGPQIGMPMFTDTSGKDFEDRSPFEWGPTAGLGYRINPNLSVDARYFYGIGKAFDVSGSKAKSYQTTVGVTHLF
jgi:opacity protein-like surface antigen